MRPSLSLPRARPRRLTVEIGVLAVIFAFGGFAAASVGRSDHERPCDEHVVQPGTSRRHGRRGQPSGHPAGLWDRKCRQLPGDPERERQRRHHHCYSAGVHRDQGHRVSRGRFHRRGYVQPRCFRLQRHRHRAQRWPGRARQLGLNIFGMPPSGAIKIASGTGNYFIALPQPVLASAIHAQCLSQGGCFWSIEVIGYPTE